MIFMLLAALSPIIIVIGAVIMALGVGALVTIAPGPIFIVLFALTTAVIVSRRVKRK